MAKAKARASSGSSGSSNQIINITIESLVGIIILVGVYFSVTGTFVLTSIPEAYRTLISTLITLIGVLMALMIFINVAKKIKG